jgi:hypothetical protein
MRSLLWLAAELALTLALLAGSPPARPADRPGLDRPAPKRDKPSYHTTDRTKFWIDGAAVTEKEFLSAHDGLHVEEIVIDGDEITLIRARTRGK